MGERRPYDTIMIAIKGCKIIRPIGQPPKKSQKCGERATQEAKSRTWYHNIKQKDDDGEHEDRLPEMDGIDRHNTDAHKQTVENTRARRSG